MFWKKKQTVPASVQAGLTVPPVTPPVTKVEVVAPKGEKLPGPRDIHELVGRHLIVELKQNPDWVWHLKCVMRERAAEKQVFDFLVFDEAQAATRKVQVRNYTSLDGYPDLILFQGRFGKKSRRVEVEEKKAA